MLLWKYQIEKISMQNFIFDNFFFFFNSFIGYVYKLKMNTYTRKEKKWIDIRQKGQCERDMESHAGHYP